MQRLYTADLYAFFHVLEAEGRFCCGPNASYASYASTGARHLTQCGVTCGA